MTAIQWISKEAKVIRKKHPKLQWSECIKKASALYKAKHKVVSKPKKVGSVAKPKKTTTSKTHKDTKSHNVNVRVVSGINRDVLSEITRLTKWNDELEKIIEQQQFRVKTDKSSTFTSLQKKYVQASIIRYKDLLKSNRKHLTQLKKQIK